jgi:hypothetical protein
MNLKLFFSRIHLPASYKRAGIAELAAATGRAFGVPPPPFPASASVETMLMDYAEFTATHAARMLCGASPVDGIRRKLFDNAHCIGTRLREELGVKDFHDFCVAARTVYRVLGIDLRCGHDGEIRVTRCFFGRYYTPEICDLMSALDSGLVAGLSGGKGISFGERITENRRFCAAKVLL